MTRGGWSERFLRHIDAPVSKPTKRAMVAWVSAEGTDAKFNPLATTQKMPGSTPFNSVGVQNFPDLQTGLAATLKTLQFQGHGYGAILRRLRKGDNAKRILEALRDSDWGTGPLALTVLDDVKSNYDSFASKAIGT